MHGGMSCCVILSGGFAAKDPCILPLSTDCIGPSLRVRMTTLLRQARRLPKSMVAIRETGDGVTFAVRVHPRAKKDAITGEIGEALKISLTAPPIEGRANEACIAFLAELLNVPRSSVTIASSQNSRNKLIRVAGISGGEFRKRLGVSLAASTRLRLTGHQDYSG